MGRCCVVLGQFASPTNYPVLRNITKYQIISASGPLAAVTTEMMCCAGFFPWVAQLLSFQLAPEARHQQASDRCRYRLELHSFKASLPNNNSRPGR